MRKLLIIGSLWIIWLPKSLFSAEVSTHAPLMLGVGEQRSLYLPDMKRFSIGNPEILRAAPLPAGLASSEDSPPLLLKGLQPGISDLRVWKSDGRIEKRLIHVKRWQDRVLTSAFQRALMDVEEVEVYLTGKKAVLRGEIRTESEASRVAALVDHFPQHIQNWTHLSRSLSEKALLDLSRWVKTTEAGHTESSSVNHPITPQAGLGKIFLESSRKLKKNEKAILLNEAKRVFPLIEWREISDSEKTIYFRVYLLEIKSEKIESLGIHWPTHLKLPKDAKTQLEWTLEALRTDGDLRILSKPEIAVQAPGEAEFFSGGELPIQQRTRYTSQVIWRPYGLTLRLNVKSLDGDQVYLDIHTEVSHLDSQISHDNIPGIRMSRMNTQVKAELGKPLFLSGLLQEDRKQQKRSLPWLGKLPFIGSLLFGTKTFQETQSELAAVLLPHFQPPLAPPIAPELLDFPKGPVPPPRNWISPQLMRETLSSPDYPWSALQ
jgi:Flp pilus assembly secretin CpaC